MSFSPGVKAASEPMLFGAPTCTVCGKEMEPSGTGRPRKYCSKACSSKSDRMREKGKREQALAAASESPRGETPLPDDLAAGAGVAELLAVSEELRRQDTVFLLQLDRAARHDDPAMARQALADVLHTAHALILRHRGIVERLLAAHPTQAAPEADAPEPVVSPRGETVAPSGNSPATDAALSTAAPEQAPAAGTPALADQPAIAAPRGETPPPASPAPERLQTPSAPVPPRGETEPSARTAAPATVAPRGETPPEGERLRHLVDQRLAQQQTASRPSPAPPVPQQPAEVPVPADPMHRRLPTSDVRIALNPQLFGDRWALAGWTVNPDVYLVTSEGHQVGWVERGLPGMGDRWAAVCENYFIGDPVTLEARLHDTREQAARTVHQAYSQNL